ncbi:glucose 1-dehydrogenase [Mycolicibacterium setense]
MSKLLSDKVILITGAGGGIGTASAELFAAEGATVVLTGRREHVLEELTEKITSDGGSASWIAADVTREADIEHAVSTVVSRHGRLDAAFNNAGVLGAVAPLADHQELTASTVMSVNVLGLWTCLRYEINAMRETGGGAIVNSSSMAGILPGRYLGLYPASKHAVVGLTKSAAAEYGPLQIRVNALATGITDTAMLSQIEDSAAGAIHAMETMVPLGRPAKPDEIAEAAAWLCSERSSYVTGAVLAVDGGATAGWMVPTSDPQQT